MNGLALGFVVLVRSNARNQLKAGAFSLAAVKELKLPYHISKTTLCTIYLYAGNLNCVSIKQLPYDLLHIPLMVIWSHLVNSSPVSG